MTTGRQEEIVYFGSVHHEGDLYSVVGCVGLDFPAESCSQLVATIESITNEETEEELSVDSVPETLLAKLRRALLDAYSRGDGWERRS